MADLKEKKTYLRVFSGKLTNLPNKLIKLECRKAHMDDDAHMQQRTVLRAPWFPELFIVFFYCHFIVSDTDHCCIQGDRAKAPDRWWQDAPCCRLEDPPAAEGPAAENLSESASDDSWACRTHTSGPGHGKTIEENINKVKQSYFKIIQYLKESCVCASFHACLKDIF